MPNIEIAEVLGCHHSLVSRYRRGQRRPSLAFMRIVQARYGWTVGEQTDAAERGTYGPAFEALVSREHLVGPDA